MKPILTSIIPKLVGSAAGKASAGSGLVGLGLGMIATRLATRSLPGAVLVGGIMVAKWAYDRKKASGSAPVDGAPVDGAPAGDVAPPRRRTKRRAPSTPRSGA